MNTLVNHKILDAKEELTLLGQMYPADQCNALLESLIADITWSEDSCVIFGRRFDIPRLQAWCADEGIRYSYSNNLLQTQSWLEYLLNIKEDIQHISGFQFNAVLLTYYRNGNDHVTWHSDDEKELGQEPVIASLSLGETRQFLFRCKHEGTISSLALNNGDLLLMKSGFQAHWQHCIPTEPSIDKPRINLTFRKVVSLR